MHRLASAIFSGTKFWFFMAMLNSNRDPLFKTAPPCCKVMRPSSDKAPKSLRMVMEETDSSAASRLVST